VTVQLLQPRVVLAHPPRLVGGDHYVIANRRYPRASNILDVIADEPKMLEKIRKEGWEWWDERGLAADLGTAVHAQIDTLHHWFNRQSALLDTGSLDLVSAAPQLEHVTLLGSEQIVFDETFSMEQDGKVKTFHLPTFVETYAREFLLPDVDEVLLSEQIVWSEKYVYAGTLDGLVRLKDGRIALLDLKTSKRLNWKYRLQTAAYAQAVWEIYGIRVDLRIIVDLPSDKLGEKLKPVKYIDQDDDFKAFRAALYLGKYAFFYKDDWKM
jgi:hypothetical protein